MSVTKKGRYEAINQTIFFFTAHKKGYVMPSRTTRRIFDLGGWGSRTTRRNFDLGRGVTLPTRVTHARTHARTHPHTRAHTHTHTHSFLLQGTTQPSTNAVEVQRNSHNFCLQGTSTPSGRLRPHHHRLFNPSSCHLGRTKHCAFSTITPRPVASAPRHVHTSRSKSGPGSWTIDATQSKEPSPLCTGMLESIVRSNNKS